MTFHTIEPYEGAHAHVLVLPEEALASAWVRVRRGSHDEPDGYPGLAHFLEHLLFLDAGRFTGDDGFMRFVQGCGGEVNASTQSFHTDFFFQVPVTFLSDALLRLQDLLLKPLPDIEGQQREREVLHAEFLARSADAVTQRDAALGAMSAAGSPLARFFAGNRDTLPVEELAFQHALSDYRRGAHIRRNVELYLAGPLELSAQAKLARNFFKSLPDEIPKARCPAIAVGPPRHRALKMRQPTPCLTLVFEVASRFNPSFERLVRSPLEQGLTRLLRAKGLARQADARRVWVQPDRWLWLVEVPLDRDSDSLAGDVAACASEWLACLDEHQEDWARRARLAGNRRLPGHTPIERIRAHIATQQSAPVALTGTGAGDVWMIRGTLEAMAPWPSDGFPFEAERWTCPGPSAHRSSLALSTPCKPAIERMPAAGNGPLKVSQLTLRMPTGWAVLYLQADVGWRSPAMEHAFDRLAWHASEHGLELSRLSGSGLGFKLEGRARLMDSVVRGLLPMLQPARADRAVAPRAEAMPIKRLFGALSEHVGRRPDAPGWSVLVCTADPLAPGLSQTLSVLPARTVPSATPLTSQWITLPANDDDTAVLMFCAHPATGAEEAGWQLLARLIEGPFYQRMRVELQLGYAVFSGYRRINGQGGLLFAIQSPHADAHMLLGHIETFLSRFDVPSAVLVDQIRTRMTADPGWQRQADQAWQYVQAGQAPSQGVSVQAELAALEQQALIDALGAISLGQYGRIILSNGDSVSPDSGTVLDPV
ncbi:pyrroloquinoline quinone biosynthesis protein PqqF [Pseudomonas sp. Marseille-QA0892]